MIVSPDLVPNGCNSLGIVMQKILVVEQEILMLNRHEREHVATSGEWAKQSISCPYCQQENLKLHANASVKQEANGKKIAILNEMEREVEISGKNGCVLVPKTWAGKRVRIMILDDDTT